MAKREMSGESKVLYLVLVLFFASLLIFVRLERVYEDTVQEVYEVVPSSDSGGFTMFNVQKVVSLEKDTAAAMMSLKPGQEFEGDLLVKNHEDKAAGFFISVFDDLQMADAEDRDFERAGIELMPAEFELEPNEWKVISYVLTVPEDMEYGSYEGLVSVRKKGTYVTSEGMSVAFAVGVEFKLDVAEELKDYEYVNIIDEFSVEDVAKEAMLLELVKIAGFFFVLLTIFFLYKAVMVDRGNDEG